jgi:O-antigen/teichoic acid export membrane protein
MKGVRSSLLLSAANSYVGLLLQIAATVVIARILTPAEAGVFAVAAVFAALGSTFRDFGVAEYLIQKKEVTTADLRASFALNLIVSWFVGGLLFVASPFAASFYRDDGVGAVMRVQAFNFVLIPFGAVTLAWFRREMNFVPIFRASLAANVVQFIISVGLALGGASYMALAWSSLAGVAVTVLVAALHRPAWFPRRPSLKGVGEAVRFGKFASGVFVAVQLGRGAPELVLGRSAGMADVGMFSRAAGVVDMFERLIGQVVSPVSLPYLARGVRDTGTVVPGLQVTSTLLTGVGWPFVFFFALAAYPAIRLLYGPQWIAAVPVAQVLCCVVALDMVYRYANQALFSLGLARQANSLQFTLLCFRLLGLAASFSWGLIGASLGLLGASLLGLLVTHRMLRTHTGYTFGNAWKACAPSAALAVIAVAPYGLLTLAWSAGEHNYVWHGLVGALLTITSWTFAARQLSHPVWAEAKRAFAALRSKLRPAKPAAL